ncbi:hypothetical protein ABIB82_000707 [Bradyrhizobium sp. i1.8.4]|uniref:hypothetical protein n=1 Tax=unclassified Bradyrhizobium TaxID=2631580 RepID=UPI003D1AABC6
MNRRAFVSGLAVIALLTDLVPAPAAADGKRVALVIGNGAYRSVPALSNAPGDAGDIAAALLRNIETPGVEVTFMLRNVRDIAVITGKLATGYWKRSVE